MSGVIVVRTPVDADFAFSFVYVSAQDIGVRLTLLIFILFFPYCLRAIFIIILVVVSTSLITTRNLCLIDIKEKKRGESINLDKA